jgi:DNA-binding XRE family transcriptional regulator
MYLMGALDSANFHRMRKVTIQLLHAQEKLGRYIDINSQSYLSIIN